MKKTLLLASASPRRAALLNQIGAEFVVQPVDVDESPLPEEPSGSLVIRLARTKAEAAYSRYSAHYSDADLYCLGADTLGDLKGHLLVKPENYEHFYLMMRAMSGQTHEILTAVSIMGPAFAKTLLCTSHVRFRRLTDEEIGCYWRSGEPQDKAGGYAIQGKAGMFVESLSGSYSSVVGLPLCETAELLQQAGFDLWHEKEQRIQR